MRRRRLTSASGRPLNFTVRKPLRGDHCARELGSPCSTPCRASCDSRFGSTPRVASFEAAGACGSRAVSIRARSSEGKALGFVWRSIAVIGAEARARADLGGRGRAGFATRPARSAFGSRRKRARSSGTSRCLRLLPVRRTRTVVVVGGWLSNPRLERSVTHRVGRRFVCLESESRVERLRLLRAAAQAHR
jgi:hypothetical protein